MQPDNTQSGPTEDSQKPSYSGSGSEKVIKPLDPNLPATATPNVVKPIDPIPAPEKTIDPPGVSHEVPTLNLKESPVQSTQVLSMQHKSLMGLAIVGLISAFVLVYLGIRLNSDITTAVREGKNIGGAQLYLYVIWASAAISLAMNTYFLFAKQRSTVALLLKVLLVIELLSVLFEAVGIGGHDVLGFVLNGGYAVYIFIVLNVIRTQPSM